MTGISDVPSNVVCDCADVAPTMPTCRTEHLWDCPVAAYLAEIAAGERDDPAVAA